MSERTQQYGTRPKDIPIVPDLPIGTPGLNYRGYAEGICSAIRGSASPRLTMGLFGAWGVGKSSLLEAIRQSFDEMPEAEEQYCVVTFNAWRYQRETSVILPLLSTIENSLNREGSKSSDWSRMAQGLGRALRKFEFSIFGVGAGWERGDPETKYVAPFEELKNLREVAGSMKVVVLVDDLDRCSPDTILNVIETIHALTDLDGFIFVLALDYSYLAKAVKQKYPYSNEHLFIEKLIQVPFHIPEITLEKESIKEIIQTWSTLDEWLDSTGDPTEKTRQIAEIILRSNPRQLKRLINVFLLNRYVSWELTTGREELLMAVLGFQIGEKDAYDQLAKAAKRLQLSSDTESEGQARLLLKDVEDSGTNEKGYEALFGDDEPEHKERSERLIEYCTKVLDPDGELTVEDFLEIHRLTASSQDAGADMSTPVGLEGAINNLSEPARALYDELTDFTRKLNFDTVKTIVAEIEGEIHRDLKREQVGVEVTLTTQYASAVGTQGPGLGTVIAEFVPKPRKNEIVVQSNRLPDSFYLNNADWIEDTGRSQHRYKIHVRPGDDMNFARNFILNSFAIAVKTGAVAAQKRGRYS